MNLLSAGRPLEFGDDVLGLDRLLLGDGDEAHRLGARLYEVDAILEGDPNHGYVDIFLAEGWATP